MPGRALPAPDDPEVGRGDDGVEPGGGDVVGGQPGHEHLLAVVGDGEHLDDEVEVAGGRVGDQLGAAALLVDRVGGPADLELGSAALSSATSSATASSPSQRVIARRSRPTCSSAATRHAGKASRARGSRNT